MLIAVDCLKEEHVRGTVADADHAGKQNPARLKIMAFRSAQSELGQRLLTGKGRRFHLAGRLSRESWQGRETLSFLLDDAACADA